MCCKQARPQPAPAYFPHPGHPWPGQQGQSVERGPNGPTGPPALRALLVATHRTSRDAHATLEPQADQVPELLTWSYLGSPDAHIRASEVAADLFAVDYTVHPEHYVAAALPALPFPDRHFRLALSANLLFVYTGSEFRRPPRRAARAHPSHPRRGAGASPPRPDRHRLLPPRPAQSRADPPRRGHRAALGVQDMAARRRAHAQLPPRHRRTRITSPAR